MEIRDTPNDTNSPGDGALQDAPWTLAVHETALQWAPASSRPALMDWRVNFGPLIPEVSEGWGR